MNKASEIEGILIHGPAGSGKSRNAQAIARHYGKARVLDEWQPRAPVPKNAVAFTNVMPCPSDAIPFSDAMQAAGLIKPR